MGAVNYGEDWMYAHTRLNHSVVRLGNAPVLVFGIMKKGIVDGMYLLKKEKVDATMDLLDLSPVALGYCNTPFGADYVGRAPSRTYRQGLTDSNFWSSRGYTNYDGKSVANTIVGNYPTMQDCVENVLCQEVPDMAFSRNFALRGLGDHTEDMSLQFKGMDVGICAWNSQAKAINYKFNEGLDFLDGLMEEALHVG